MSDPDARTRSLPLPSGAGMPLLGFGTWQLRGEAAREATLAALRAGYRHVDTATMYGNEKEVGAALRDSGVDPAEVLVTTKLPPDRAGQPREVLAESLALLGLPAVGLWLLHWPTAQDRLVDTWRALLAAREDGLARDVGVSNFSLAELDLLAEETGVAPAVNQISWSPLRHDPQVLAGHRRRGVVLEGYSGLRTGALEHPVVGRVAAETGRTPAQVVLRWHLQHDVVAIPKSADPARIAQNADLGFVLSADQMAALDALGSGSPGAGK